MGQFGQTHTVGRRAPRQGEPFATQHQAPRFQPERRPVEVHVDLEMAHSGAACQAQPSDPVRADLACQPRRRKAEQVVEGVGGKLQ